MEQILTQNETGYQEHVIFADRQLDKIKNPQLSQQIHPTDLLRTKINKYLYGKKRKHGLLKLIQTAQEILPTIPLGFTYDNVVVVDDGTDNYPDKTKAWLRRRQEILRLRGARLIEHVSTPGNNFRKRMRKWLRRALNAIELGMAKGRCFESPAKE